MDNVVNGACWPVVWLQLSMTEGLQNVQGIMTLTLVVTGSVWRLVPELACCHLGSF